MEAREIALALAAQAERVCSALLPGGKRVGKQWVCGDVSGKPGDSLQVELEGSKQGLWIDRANVDSGGDMLTLVADVQMVSTGKACAWALDFLGIKNDYRPEKNGQFNPLEMRWMDKKSSEWVTGTSAWPYHSEKGDVIGYVVRFDFPDGRKDVIPIRNINGEYRWKGWSKEEGKPLFNLHKLMANPEKPVLVVEGEKTAVAAQALLPDYVVTTCQGGAPAFPYGQWEPLAKRTIILWPDADKPGRTAMTYLKARFSTARVVRTETLPEGWDLADPITDGVSIKGLIDGATDTAAPPPTPTAAIPCPFRPLGHIDDDFFYLSHLSGRVVSLTAQEHTELPLQMISNDAYWLSKGFAQEKSNGVDWKAVAKHLFALQWDVGVYDSDNIRGIGCWLEGPKIVYHAGDHLIVDGVKTAILSHESKFIYPSRRRIEINTNKIASVEDIAPFLELCDLLPWETPSGWILASFCSLAPICGALYWRPSAALDGPPGVGKSYTIGNILIPLIGPCIEALSETTAAAIRQIIGCDAIPVVIDEFEARDAKSREIVSGMIALNRQSSSESGGSIYKGSPSGHVHKYRVRSCFMYSAIAMAVFESADESRIVRLRYRKRLDAEAKQNFKRIQELAIKTTLNPAFCQAFIYRAISKASMVRDAAGIFGDAIRDVTHDARTAQQYGTFAAGDHHLKLEHQVTPEQAGAWARSIQWDAIGNSQVADLDTSRAADILLQAKIDMTDAHGKTTRFNIGEILDTYYEDPDPAFRTAAYEALMRTGIHPVRGDQWIDIAVRHTELAKVFEKSHFANLWSDYFKRVDGASESVFTPRGAVSIRSVRIPKAHFTESKQEVEK